MEKTSNIEAALHTLEFLNSIKGSVPVEDFVRLELTGDQIADGFLSKISVMMLKQLIKDGMVDADDLSKPGAKIYGLTKQGQEMYKLFISLSHH